MILQLTLRTFLTFFQTYSGLLNSPKTLANQRRDPLGVHTLPNSHFPTWGKKIPLLFLLSPIFPKPLFSFQVLSCRKKLSFPSSITPLLFTTTVHTAFQLIYRPAKAFLSLSVSLRIHWGFSIHWARFLSQIFGWPGVPLETHGSHLLVCCVPCIVLHAACAK